MCTMMSNNLIKWCQWDHLLEGILKGLRVRAAGLKLFMVSIEDLVCQLCIGCSLSLGNNGTKLCVVTDIFVTSYSFWLIPTIWYILYTPALFMTPWQLPNLGRSKLCAMANGFSTFLFSSPIFVSFAKKVNPRCFYSSTFCVVVLMSILILPCFWDSIHIFKYGAKISGQTRGRACHLHWCLHLTKEASRWWLRSE